MTLVIYTRRAPDHLIAFVGPTYGKLSLCLSYIINIFISAHSRNLENWQPSHARLGGIAESAWDYRYYLELHYDSGNMLLGYVAPQCSGQR